MTLPPTKDRQTWMSVLAKAAPGRLAQLLPALPEHRFLRSPEVGAVMVRGRIGGTGEAFNLGEMTVTRASVQLSAGSVGHAWVQGRDKAHATRAAIVDALMQTDAAPEIGKAIVDVLATEATEATAARAARAATTKVDFFTLVRGEDK
ncbi:phosphonate C-P lyase system protein PhnG [Tabrizicola sp. BL-A-41-H6]|uniref:phosphonate C-P lyase system protein PhnG n=1 Tax=Tabrizicola sp. BL-A-41-H6 TaxID=3421107 RepID=UPI003D67BB67